MAIIRSLFIEIDVLVAHVLTASFVDLDAVKPEDVFFEGVRWSPAPQKPLVLLVDADLGMGSEKWACVGEHQTDVQNKSC